MLKRMQSNLSGNTMSVWGRMSSFFGDDVSDNDKEDDDAAVDRKGITSTTITGVAMFATGVSVGLLIATKVGLRKM